MGEVVGSGGQADGVRSAAWLGSGDQHPAARGGLLPRGAANGRKGPLAFTGPISRPEAAPPVDGCAAEGVERAT